MWQYLLMTLLGTTLPDIIRMLNAKGVKEAEAKAKQILSQMVTNESDLAIIQQAYNTKNSALLTDLAQQRGWGSAASAIKRELKANEAKLKQSQKAYASAQKKLVQDQIDVNNELAEAGTLTGLLKTGAKDLGEGIGRLAGKLTGVDPNKAGSAARQATEQFINGGAK